MSIQAINVRNQFRGQIKEIIRGDVLSEIDVETPAGIVTSVITTRSPYIARASFTLWQGATPPHLLARALSTRSFLADALACGRRFRVLAVVDEAPPPGEGD